MATLIGKIFNYIEKAICNNLRNFVGKHEQTTNILFLITYIILQLILVYCFPKPIVTLIVILFLFFLSLERIILRIWLDEEKRRYDLKEQKIKEKISILRNFYTNERTKLIQKIEKLKNVR